MHVLLLLLLLLFFELLTNLPNGSLRNPGFGSTATAVLHPGKNHGRLFQKEWKYSISHDVSFSESAMVGVAPLDGAEPVAAE